MKKAKVQMSSCVACGVCVKGCPKSAISIYKGSYAVVDTKACVGCGICERSCPTGAIQVEAVSNE